MNDSPVAGHPARPRTIVCVKVDTLGDLILFAPALAALRSAWSETRIAVVIRRAYADLAPLLVDGIEWLDTTLDPFAQGPDAAPEELSRLQAAVAELRPDLIAAATSRRNWLEIVLAARSAAPQRIAMGTGTDDEFFATQLRVRLGVDAQSAFTRYVARPASEPDWRSNFALVDAVLGKPAERRAPTLKMPAAVRTSAVAVIHERGLAPGRFAICAAAGFANVALKTWPPTHFAAVIRHLSERHQLPTVLVGQRNEHDYLRAIAEQSGGAATVWTGAPGELPILGGLIAESALFIGNDTGAMHLASGLEKPVVAVFGGGTWPRFVPAGNRSVAVVQPLPCFGCGWDCAFGDAPCIREIQPADVNRTIDTMLASTHSSEPDIVRLEYLPASTREMMGKAAARYREARNDHLARQHKLEEITDLDLEKDAAIHEKEAAIAEKETAVLAAEAAMKIKEASIFEKEAEIHAKEREIDELKKICDEREKLIVELDRNCRSLQAQLTTIVADKALLEKTVRELPEDRGYAAETIAGQGVHIRNLEALLQLRDREIAELKASATNLAAGRHDLEQAKRYAKLLAEKEVVIRDLHRSCQEREAVIRQLTAEATGVTGALWKLKAAAAAYWREKVARPSTEAAIRRLVDRHWMQIGVLRQYAPKPVRWDRLPGASISAEKLPKIGIVTPSYGQEQFIERTLKSVLEQGYPKLCYVVQDGGSRDRSPEIIARYSDRLHHWESVKDAGQADAIARGFGHMAGGLGPNDLMAWLNSDDMLAPGALFVVAQFFAQNPNVDVVYGHRIIIDEADREVGRWVMPPHDPESLQWVDYIPQETMFWRKSAWDLVGGIDPSFQFALDWDLLARFQQSGCRMVRLPYYLGAFRVHAEQKTSQVIHTTGADEMRRIRTRFHGAQQDNTENIERAARRTRIRGVMTARLLELGIRR